MCCVCSQSLSSLDGQDSDTAASAADADDGDDDARAALNKLSADGAVGLSVAVVRTRRLQNVASVQR